MSRNSGGQKQNWLQLVNFILVSNGKIVIGMGIGMKIRMATI